MSYHEVKQKALYDAMSQYLISLLVKHRGNVSRSADEANMDRSNFLRVCKKYNIEPVTYRIGK